MPHTENLFYIQSLLNIFTDDERSDPMGSKTGCGVHSHRSCSIRIRNDNPFHGDKNDAGTSLLILQIRVPFSFFRYVEPASGEDSQGRLAFIAPAFMLDVLVWYMLAYLAIRFYDGSSPV